MPLTSYWNSPPISVLGSGGYYGYGGQDQFGGEVKSKTWMIGLLAVVVILLILLFTGVFGESAQTYAVFPFKWVYELIYPPTTEIV